MNCHSPGGHFSANLKAFRQQLGLSQQELADRCGIPRGTIAGLENCVGNPTLQIMVAIARGLNQPLERLLSTPDSRLRIFRNQECVFCLRHSQLARGREKKLQIARLNPNDTFPVVIESGNLEKGQSFSPLIHPAREYVYLLSGKLQIEMGSESEILSPYDLAVIDSGYERTWTGLESPTAWLSFSLPVEKTKS